MAEEAKSDTLKATSRRESIWEEFDRRREAEAVEAPVQPEEVPAQPVETSQKTEPDEGSPPKEVEHPEEGDQPKPPRLYANKYKTPEEMESAYVESEKRMHEESQKRSDT